ncbi:unannotated protein [freshwater metagenome]|uniref:Unannotated protein n=1 Tax=freshwater metagenome TaxID=449393 RepID=A0A6J6XX38_9ZZZZ
MVLIVLTNDSRRTSSAVLPITITAAPIARDIRTAKYGFSPPYVKAKVIAAESPIKKNRIHRPFAFVPFSRTCGPRIR